MNNKDKEVTHRERRDANPAPPSLKLAIRVTWAWVWYRWHILWLAPDLVLFLVVIVLLSTFSGDLIQTVSPVTVSIVPEKALTTLSWAFLSAGLLIIAYKGGKWQTRFAWRKRSTPFTWRAGAKTIFLIATVISLHRNGATTKLMEFLDTPAMTATEQGANVCVANAETPPSIAKLEVEAMYRRLTSSPELRRQLAKTFNRVNQFSCQIKMASRDYDLPESFIAAVAATESGGDERAVSPMGAKGLMQLMPVNYHGQNPLDADSNIELGAQLLRNLVNEKRGDYAQALALYNASHGANERAKKLAAPLDARTFWQRKDFLPKETREYVPRVFALEIAWREWQEHKRIRSYEERHGLVSLPQDQVSPAQKINAPLRHHVVRRGDTTSAILRQNGVDLNDLKRLNKGFKPDAIQIGQVLQLPSDS